MSISMSSPLFVEDKTSNELLLLTSLLSQCHCGVIVLLVGYT